MYKKGGPQKPIYALEDDGSDDVQRATGQTSQRIRRIRKPFVEYGVAICLLNDRQG